MQYNFLLKKTVDRENIANMPNCSAISTGHFQNILPA